MHSSLSLANSLSPLPLNPDLDELTGPSVCTVDQTNGAKLGFYMVSFFGFGFAAPFLASAFQMCANLLLPCCTLN